MEETTIATTKNAKILATALPTTAAIASERKCCNACEATKPTEHNTISETTTATADAATISKATKTNPKQTFSSTRSRSIFSWLKSAPKAVDSDKGCSTTDAADDTPTATPTTTTATATRAQSADCTVQSSYREFRGVQSLRNLWNKRISAIETTTTTTTNVKAKKLNKSISCLASVSAYLYEPPVGVAGGDSVIEATAKRRQTHTKRAQSLHDCTQSSPDFAEEVQSTIVREIDTLHREKDNFYKYKTAEQASKQGTRRRLTSVIVRGSEKSTQGFPAIKSSDKGEHIHWLRLDEIIMTANQHKQASDDMQHQGSDLLTGQAATCDKSRNAQLDGTSPPTPVTDAISSLQIMPPTCDSGDNLANANSQLLASDASNASSSSSRKTSASSDCTSKCNSNELGTSSLTRARKYPAARKYSFKTHSKTYHSPRNRPKGEGSAATGSASGPTAYSMVAKLTQQFNEIIQKDKKLLEEVKRKNGVLMSRGGHVYKVVEKSDHHQSRSSPGISRANSNVKDLNSPKAALNVRRTIKKFEGGGTALEKPQVPTKSLQVLLKREELVSSKQSQQQSSAKSMHNIKRSKPSSGQTLQSSDKAECQLKLELKKLEVVTEESKTPLEGDERSIVEVLPVNVSSSSEANSTYVLAANKNDDDASSNNQIVDAKAKVNMVNHAETGNGEGDGDRARNAIMQQRNKVVRAVNKVGEDDVAEKRPDPEGQATDNGHSEQLTSHSVATQVDGDENVNRAAEQREFMPTSFPTTLSDTEAKVDADELEEEKLKQRKHRYAKIYEKFRFRSPFHGAHSKKSSPSGSPEKNFAKEEEAAANKDVMMIREGDEADAKILDALDVIDQKLKGLAAAEPATSIVLCANDDFEQRLLPNSSFIYQSTAKQVLGNQLIVTQAVNVALVNTIGGEQMLKGQEERLLMEGNTMPPIKVIEIEATREECKAKKEEEVDMMNVEEEDGREDEHEYESENEKQIANASFEEEKKEDIEYLAKEEGEQKETEKEEIKVVKEGSNMEMDMEMQNQKQEDHISMDMEEENTKQPEAKSVKIAMQNGVKGVDIEKESEEENATQMGEKMYESIVEAKEPTTECLNPQVSFIFKSCKMVSNDHSNDGSAPSAPLATSSFEEEMYQTLDEIRLMRLHLSERINHAIRPDSSQNDYESIAGSSEHSTPIASKYILKTTPSYDGYETYEPPDESSPKTVSLVTTPPTALVRNTNDELPALPEPKRKLTKPSMPAKVLKTPPKPTCQRMNSVPPSHPTTSPPSTQTHLTDDDDRHYYADDENIYDTIKGSHCYESLQALINKPLQKSSPKSLDNISLGSNCYESITQYRRPQVSPSYAAGAIPIRNAGSTSTISSDHKTNSLYEASIASGLLYGAGSIGTGVAGGRRSGSVSGSGSGSGSGSAASNAGGIGGIGSIHYSNAASSDGNSDEWVDITDNEADGSTVAPAGGGVKQQFIVVRERSKLHRSPDWSKRVRDKRLQQKAISCIEDDSDHYYESLSPPFCNKRHSTQLTQHTSSHHKRIQDLPRYPPRGSQPRQQHSASAHALGQAVVSDDYDSFDTDTDDIYELEDQLKNHHDSGVDIRNVKLPDPPVSTNQVYAMVKKLKNFISNKKSPNASKYGGSQQKIYENSSQFYLESNIYQDSPKASKLTANNKVAGLKTSPRSCAENDDYENTNFHAPPIILTSAAKQFSSSEKNISIQRTNTTESKVPATAGIATAATTTATTPRSKSKSGKSFKSRLRKSLVGSTFDSKQLSALTPTRSTFYIEDPSGSGELDSGFSEKGDLTGDRTLEPTTDSNTTPTSDQQKFCTVSRKPKKDVKSSNSQRRRTTIGMRPHEPPPPPPPVEDAQLRAKQRNATANTSWYAECGVFKNSAALHADHHLALNDSSNSSSSKSGPQNQPGSVSLSGGSHTSWYAEAGLYQTSGASVASSSGSSGVSTGNEAGIGDDMPHSLLQNEPLYQIYSAAKLQSISRDLEDQENDSSTDGYEEIGQHGVPDDFPRTDNSQRHSRPSALQLIGPKNGPSRTLWSEIPEVINSCILLTLTPRERGLQEAKFEIITSEASYLKSLNLLRSHFMNHPVFRDTSVVSARDRKALFSYIVPVHECSERLLTALESCWQDNIMLLGLSKRIYAIAEKNFHVYISFCEQQGRMDRTLRRLKESKGTFSQNLDLLESSPTCCGLNLHSFLMLPMQRITRLPLLIDAVFSKTSPNDDEYDSWKMTLAIMNKIVAQCNEAANRCEQTYEIERIARQLEFPTTVRALAIAPVGVSAPGAKPRFLVKKGELTHLIWRGDDAKLTFGKRFTKTAIFAFLFSDLLVLTKRKAEQQFQVFDYCPRNMLSISSGELLPQLPTRDSNQTGKNLILMTLLENHERKTVELVLSCPSVSEQERWLQAMRPPEAETPGEKLYEQWDCPQVVTTHAYESKEPDALNLEVGDVVNVTRKLLDGWYQGERIRDGAIGWFPGNHTEEVNSAHVRARNLKQRYRLLTFTASYLETQKRK